MAEESTIIKYNNKEEALDIFLSFRFTFGKDFDYPREEAINRILMKSMYGTSEHKSCTIEEIQKKLETISDMPLFRLSIIKESIERLVNKGIVGLKEKNRYYLKIEYTRKISEELKESKQLFEKCVEKVIQNVREGYSLLTNQQEEKVQSVFQDFLKQVFSKFGYQCARLITGKCSAEDILDSPQAKKIFDTTCSKYGIIEGEFLSSVKNTMYNFFRKPDPDYQKLEFHLAQNFYVLKLLGIDPDACVLSKQAFSNAQMYLDTNVVITSLLTEAKPYRSFKEFHKISEEIGVEIKVSQITHKEIKNVIGYQKDKDFSRVYENIPESVKEEVNDNFYQTYIKAKQKNSVFSIKDLFLPFENLGDTLQKNFNIYIEDKPEYKEILGDEETLEKIEKVVQEKSIEKRGREKGPFSLHHDAFHFILVGKKREENPKTWFLTLDKSLPFVSEELLGTDSSPFCFTLDSWLQCISPFVCTEEEIKDFSFIFSNVFASKILPFEQVYSIEDFILFTDFELDIKQMPKPMVNELVLFVKKEILKGNTYDNIIRDEAFYKLRRYLIQLQEKYFREKEEWQEKAQGKDKIISDLQLEMQGLNDDIYKIREKQKEREKKERKSYLRNRWLGASVVWIVAIFFWVFPWMKSNISPFSSFWSFILPFILIISGFFIPFRKQKVLRIIGYFTPFIALINILYIIWNFFNKR